MIEIHRCDECGDRACICEDDGMWAAHCMLCDKSIGKAGYYDPCASSKAEAIKLWNDININK